MIAATAEHHLLAVLLEPFLQQLVLLFTAELLPAARNTAAGILARLAWCWGVRLRHQLSLQLLVLTGAACIVLTPPYLQMEHTEMQKFKPVAAAHVCEGPQKYKLLACHHTQLRAEWTLPKVVYQRLQKVRALQSWYHVEASQAPDSTCSLSGFDTCAVLIAAAPGNICNLLASEVFVQHNEISSISTACNSLWLQVSTTAYAAAVSSPIPFASGMSCLVC